MLVIVTDRILTQSTDISNQFITISLSPTQFLSISLLYPKYITFIIQTYIRWVCCLKLCHVWCLYCELCNVMHCELLIRLKWPWRRCKLTMTKPKAFKLYFDWRNGLELSFKKRRDLI